MHRRRPLPLLRIAAVGAMLAVGIAVVPAAATDRVVVVEPGDTLSEIALAHGISLDQLVAWNAISDPNRIYAGQRLRITAPVSTTSTGATASAPAVHVVRDGENLTVIARRYGTTIGALVAANGIADPSYLQVGQHLTLRGAQVGPAATAPPAAAVAPALPPPISHTVVAGENLTFIARHYGTSIDAIVAANAIADPSYLHVGQRLTIPDATTAGEASAAVPASMRAAVEARAGIRALIVEEATAAGVPIAFALAVAWQESGWQPKVVSSAGAVGVMQLMPATADWVAATMLGGTVDLRDARWNVRAGVTLLRHYLDRYHGDKALVLAAYFQGQTAADRHGVYAVTRPYVASVLALEAIFAR